MTTEARDALAAAWHKAFHTYRGDFNLCVRAELDIEPADRLLAALDGWTLVPTSTVADAEALERLPEWYTVSRVPAGWQVIVVFDPLRERDFTPTGEPVAIIRPTLAAAVAAALGDEP